MADNQVSNDIQWTKIQNAIRGRDKQGPAADQASKLLAANSLVRENGKGTWSAQDIRSLANEIDAENKLGADNGYMPGDILNGIYSGAGGIIDDLWDNSLGKFIPGGADWFTGEDIGSALDIASDIGLSLIPGAGIPLVIGKNLLQNTRNISDALSGYNSVTGQYLNPQQQAMKLAGTAGTVAMSALPFGIGKLGKLGGKVVGKGDDLVKLSSKEAQKRTAENLGKLAKDVETSEYKAATNAAKEKLANQEALIEEASLISNADQAAKAVSALEAEIPKLAENASAYTLEELPTGFINVERNFLQRLRGNRGDLKSSKKEFRDAKRQNKILENEKNALEAEKQGLKEGDQRIAEINERIGKIGAEQGGLNDILKSGRAGRYAKSKPGMGSWRERNFSLLGGKGQQRIRNLLDDYAENPNNLAVRYLDDLVRHDRDSAVKVMRSLGEGDVKAKDLLGKVGKSRYKNWDELVKGAEKAKPTSAAKESKALVQRIKDQASKDATIDWIPSSRAANLGLLAGGLATQYANMYGNGADPITAFIDNPDRIIANLIGSAAFKRPTKMAVASKRYGAMNTAQRAAAKAQRMNYLNRLAQDQYGLDQDLTDDQIAALISGEAYQEEADNILRDDILRQVYGYVRR